MLDTRVIDHAENARLVLGVPEKEPRNPLLPVDQPWENATNNYYPNLLWDAEERVWKLWYKDVLADKSVQEKMINAGVVASYQDSQGMTARVEQDRKLTQTLFGH